MSFLTDLIKEKASEVLADKISIPESIQEQVLGGVADSIFGSVKETAGKEGGMDQLIELLPDVKRQAAALWLNWQAISSVLPLPRSWVFRQLLSMPLYR